MPPKNKIARISDIKKIADGVYRFSLIEPAIAACACPGNFIHVKVPGVVLRRPLSIHNVKGKELAVLFRVRGDGTAFLSQFQKGDALDILGPLGNGFKLGTSRFTSAKNILVGGGLGVAPLLFLAFEIRRRVNNPPLVLLGARHRNDIFTVGDFKKLGCKVLIATDDGSAGIKGNAVDLLRASINDCDKINIFACGPEPMFKAIHAAIVGKNNIICQVSFEQFMGCGVGICCGCALETRHGYKKVCKDGPVFDINEVF